MYNGFIGAELFKPENTHSPCKGKFHYMADILFYLFGFSCFAYV